MCRSYRLFRDLLEPLRCEFGVSNVYAGAVFDDVPRAIWYGISE